MLVKRQKNGSFKTKKEKKRGKGNFFKRGLNVCMASRFGILAFMMYRLMTFSSLETDRILHFTTFC